MHWWTIVVPAAIAGLSAIAGSLVQRSFQVRDQKRQREQQLEDDQRRRNEQLEDERRRQNELIQQQVLEKRRLSDAASLRALHPILQELRHQFEFLSPGLRNGVASSNVFEPDAEFYKVAEAFRHTAESVWILDETLRVKLHALLQVLHDFSTQTNQLAQTKALGVPGAGTPIGYGQQIVALSALQRQALETFLTTFADFRESVATTVGLADVV